MKVFAMPHGRLPLHLPPPRFTPIEITVAGIGILLFLVWCILCWKFPKKIKKGLDKIFPGWNNIINGRGF